MKETTKTTQTHTGRKKIWLILVCIVGIAAGLLIFEAVFGFWNPVRRNGRAFSQALKGWTETAAGESPGGESSAGEISTGEGSTGEVSQRLSELTPFEWDSVYCFDPYVTKEEMEEVLGFSSPHLEESVSDSKSSVIFVKDQSVVCAVVETCPSKSFPLYFGHWENRRRENRRNFMRIDSMTDEFVVKQNLNFPYLAFEGKYFFGTVEETSKDGMAVVSVGEDEPENEEILRSGSQVSIFLNEEWNGFLKPGDKVRVRYDGVVMESFPLQLGGQMEVQFLGGSGVYCGFLRSIDEDGHAWIDFAQWITDEDTEGMQRLNLTAEDMPDGYYIYNPYEKAERFALADDAVYTFIDWGRDFVTSDKFEDLLIDTADLTIFKKYLDTYQDSQPGMPFFFEMEDGRVKSITEKPIM